MNNIFFELTTVLILAGLISFIVSLLKQPSIIAYIITGLVVGPLGYYRLQQGDVFSALAQIGITLLLFMVGLQLDIGQLRRIGKTALLVGLGQVFFTSIIGYVILRALGFSAVSSLYIAPALTFSSTIIVVKLLGEKKDLQSLYGKLVVGIFLTQDFVAILILISLSSITSSGNTLYAGLPLWENITMALVRALILILSIWWLSAKVFPKIMEYVGNNDELMLVFSLAWALGLAAFVASPLMGFNLEIGGFLAGLSLAGSGVHYEISGKIKPIRDFFIIIFFIVLGSGLALNNLSLMAKPAIILSLFVLIGNPLIVMILLGLFGYKPRTGFLAGVTVGQISEFSLILVSAAYAAGNLSQNEVSLVTLIGIITIAISSYMIMSAAQIYETLHSLLKIFDFRKGAAEKHLHAVVLKNHIILVGAHRLGHHLIETLQNQKTPFVVVDFNPEVVEFYFEKGITAVCGDITDSFIQEQINLPYAKMIISTVPDFVDNMALLYAIRRTTADKRFKPKLIFIAQDETETKALYEAGVDYVISPHFMGGMHLAKILEGRQASFDLKKLREHHLKILLNHNH
jgi:Kef-type K+ transport system membrane component KefB/voltage-gated potassium channel Kch